MAAGDSVAEMTKKTCSRCHSELPSSCFYNASAAKDGKHRWCKGCCAGSRRALLMDKDRRAHRDELKKRWDGENQHHRLTSGRKRELWKRYGLSWEKYLAMLDAQGGCCALCKTASPGGHQSKLDPLRHGNMWAVDHDHKTMRVRGLLCANCNRWIGVYELLKDRYGLDVIEAYLNGMRHEVFDIRVARMRKSGQRSPPFCRGCSIVIGTPVFHAFDRICTSVQSESRYARRAKEEAVGT